MASDNSHLKVSDSIGKAQGATLHRTNSRESLATHPLLSSSPNEATSITDTINSSSPPQPTYVPYVPRQQRPLPTSPSTAAKSAVSSTPVSRQTPTSINTGSPSGTITASAATSKLQLQNLKAAAQKIGLNGTSFGWAMLEKLANEAEYEKAWTALTVGKATLLLPAEDSFIGEKISSDMVEDHVVFFDLASRASTPVVTLSGLRGTLKESTLTFQSTLSPSCKSFQPLHTPSLRISGLLDLPPLHTTFGQYVYPKFTVYPNVATLPIPPQKKPPLPPRPGAQPAPTTPVAASRLSNPFASLFGGRSVVPIINTPIPTNSTPLETDKVIEISAIVIDRKILMNPVSRQIFKEMKREVQDTLKDAGVPNWVSERVFNFMSPYLPVMKSKRTGIYGLQDDASCLKSSAELSDAFQDFYEELEHEMRNTKGNARRQEDNGSEPIEREKSLNGVKVREIMEAVERVSCTMLLDRLLRPDSSDDAQHDEALAGRIAALNLLDLTPEHLGMDVGQNDRPLATLVYQCGKALNRLTHADCQSPGEKATALVAAHHVLVDGLSKLPPIKLMPEQDISAPKASPRTPNNDGFSPVEKGNGSHFFGTPAITQITLEQELKPISPKVSLKEELKEDEPSTKEEQKKENGDKDKTHKRTESTKSVEGTTTVSGDILLPLIIYSVVKCNPAHLVSNLLFVQRFRNRSFGGEESYSLVNLMAVVEFLEHVDLQALGLDDTDRVISAETLTPIPIGADAGKSSQSTAAALRGRVVQQADAIAGSANKLVSGVVDSSIGALKILLSSNPADGNAASTSDIPGSSWNPVRPGIGLLRRASGFSIASMAASLPGSHKAQSLPLPAEEGQQLKDVTSTSRPNSIREEESGEEESEYEESEEEEDDGEGEGVFTGPLDVRSDSRSVRSFSSMMSSASRSRKRERKARKSNKERKSLADRFATMSGLGKSNNASSLDSPIKDSPPRSRRVSMVEPSTSSQTVMRSSDGSYKKVAPAKKRFLESSAFDLRLSEVNELLGEYRRVVAALSELDGFEGVPQ